ncbi:GmrSD restriction endonuclease domain-containing protein [Paraoerskovia marina]|uniref:GmrSD restriction endonuclease domain-containing protein n=1 Tax=Paraoerskovia marina TaxID=545619 RepID=UPI000A83450B|nr:DUF1524 domain-containing protein [Paraoerskovia marina]
MSFQQNGLNGGSPSASGGKSRPWLWLVVPIAVAVLLLVTSFVPLIGLATFGVVLFVGPVFTVLWLVAKKRGIAGWSRNLGLGTAGLAIAGVVLISGLGAQVPAYDAAEQEAQAVAEAAEQKAADEAAALAEEEAAAEKAAEEARAAEEKAAQEAAEAEAVSQAIADAKTDTALAAVADLTVKGRAPQTGYDRDLFNHWTDPDDNGCDTRNDILRRDLTGITVDSDDCTVLTGTLLDPYTDTTIDFTRGVGTSNDVQIDHVVALSDAWQKGAQQMTDAQREAFANDPLNLLAVDGPTNASKGAGDAATWLPPNKAFRCEYVALQVAVKLEYELWVTEAEKDAIARVLSACADEPLPEAEVAVAASEDDEKTVIEAPKPTTKPSPAPEPAPAPEPEPEPEPKPAPEPEPAPVAVYYENCSAVRAAGADPIRVGEPGYSRKLDRDGDGVGCE